MSRIIKDADGLDVEVLTREVDGMVDSMLRSDNKVTFEAAALTQGLLVEGEGELVPAPGANIDVIGPIPTTPGTYDDEGNELTPPVMDNRYHVNLRITGPMMISRNTEGLLKHEVTALNWSQHGTKTKKSNKSETGKTLYGITQLDMDSVNTPWRVWL